MPLICPTAKAKYFCEGGLDRANQLEFAGDFFPGRTGGEGTNAEK